MDAAVESSCPQAALLEPGSPVQFTNGVPVSADRSSEVRPSDIAPGAKVSPAPDVLQNSAAAVSSASEANGGSSETLSADILRLRDVLDSKVSTEAEQLQALQKLRLFGTLPTKVLSDTLIGKTVNQIAKAAADESVRTSARELVEDWRQVHRKRKAASMENLPAPAPAPALQRNLSNASMFSDTAPETSPQKLSISRQKVLVKIVDALGKEEEIESKAGIGVSDDKMRDPAALAGEIEQALFDQLPEKEYTSQARALLFNLKDKKNYTFRFKLMVGFYKPSQVPKLTAEDMASDEKNAERAKMRQYAMEEIQTDWDMKHGNQRITGMFTCGKCKGVKTTYFQMQTRSSDEPMTTFVTCLTCSNRWKFC